MNTENTAIKNGSNLNDSQDAQAKGFRKWLPLIILSLALTIIILDTTILNVSLRTIINDLHTTIQKIQWVITAYSLMLAAFTITGGRLGDLFGRKKMFVFGALIFAVGSFITSISHTVGVMISGESIIEGVGAALMMPATASLLVSNYKGRDRAIAFGIWGGIAAAAAALGPVLGGWITTHYTWRWAFRINIFVAVLLAAGSVLIREFKEHEEKTYIDFTGVILSSLGMLSIVFGLIQSSVYGWWTAKDHLIIFGHAISFGSLSATPLFILLGLIILGIFGWWEGRVGKKGNTPLVSLKLFQNRQFLVGASITGFLSLALAGLSFSTPVFLQAVKNLNPLNTGIAMLPMSLSILVAAPFSSYLVKHVSAKRIIQAGLIIVAVGFFALRAALAPAASVWGLAPGFALFGIGMGLIMAQSNNLTLSAVSVEQAGEASGVNNTFRQLGSTLGSAVMGAVLISALSANLASGITNSSVIPQYLKPTISNAVVQQTSNIEFGSGVNSVANSSVPAFISNEIVSISKKGTVDANKSALTAGVIFVFVGIAVSFGLPEQKDIETESSIAGSGESDTQIEMIPRKRARVIGLSFAVILAGATALAGYHYGTKNSAPQNANIQIQQNQNQQNNLSAAPGIRSSNPVPAPEANQNITQQAPVQQQPAMKNYTNTGLHFSAVIPSSWHPSQNADLITFQSGTNQIRIQSDFATTNDLSALKNYLAGQSNIHNISETKFDGMPALQFSIDGKLGQGYALLQNNRLYYLLGNAAGQVLNFKPI